MNILFLDDCPYRCKAFRSRVPSAVIVNTARACIEMLAKNITWDEVHLDHDLGGITYADQGDPETGSEVVRYMMLNPGIASTVIVHSHNGVAAPVMVENLKAAGYYVLRIPFQAGHDNPSNERQDGD